MNEMTEAKDERPSTIAFGVQHDELGELANAINEVLNGFTVPDFDRRIGARVDTERLQRHVGDVYRANSEGCEASVKLDAAQVQILVNALKVVLEEFASDSEFETRMGCTRPHASSLLQRLKRTQT